MSNITPQPKLDAASLKAKLAALQKQRDSGQLVAAQRAEPSVASPLATLTEQPHSHVEVINRIADLDAALNADSPNLPYVLKDIHSLLAQYPDTVHLLSDKERGVIVASCFKYSGTVIVTTNRKAGKSSDGKVKLSAVTTDMI